MKNFIFIASLLILVLVFGCKNVDNELDGTWEHTSVEGAILKFANGEFELLNNGLSIFRGSFTTKDKILTREITHYGDIFLILYVSNPSLLGSDWHTKDEMLILSGGNESEMESLLSEYNTLSPSAYSINGNTLSLTWAEINDTWTRISRDTSIGKTAVSEKPSVITFFSNLFSGNSRNRSSTNTGRTQDLVGRWVGENQSWGFDLLSDGTGIFDKQTITWKIEGNRLYILAISSFGDSGSFEFRMSGSVLTLIDDDGYSFTFRKR